MNGDGCLFFIILFTKNGLYCIGYLKIKVKSMYINIVIVEITFIETYKMLMFPNFNDIYTIYAYTTYVYNIYYVFNNIIAQYNT